MKTKSYFRQILCDFISGKINEIRGLEGGSKKEAGLFFELEIEPCQHCQSSVPCSCPVKSRKYRTKTPPFCELSVEKRSVLVDWIFHCRQ